MPLFSDLPLERAGERAVWAAYVFPVPAHLTYGAVRGSARLHWTRAAARAEAEKWARELGLDPPLWQPVDETAAVAWFGERALIVYSYDLPLAEPIGDGRRWAAFLFAPGAGTIVHPAFGVMRGTRQLHATGRAARTEAEGWARELNLIGQRLPWDVIDDTGMVAWVGYGAFVVRSILLPHGEPPA
jgi:hypothetical protein